MSDNFKKILRKVQRGYKGPKNVWPKKFLEETPCPLCQSFKRKHLYPQIYPRLVGCSSCQLIYTDPRLKGKYLKQLYNQQYFQNENSSFFGYQNYLADEEKIKKTFEKRLKTIEKMQKKGRLLDFGCAAGFFLQVAIENGWQAEGVEISPFAVNYARSHLHLNVHQADLQEIDFPKKSFDLITLWDVLEHLSNPLSAFKKIREILKDDGLLVFSTPDVGSIPARLTKHRWIGYKLSDEHLTYFSLPTIYTLCEKTGFEIVKSHHLGKYVSFSLLADRVGFYNQTLGNVLKLFNKFVPKDFNFYLSAFDILCLYLRKK